VVCFVSEPRESAPPSCSTYQHVLDLLFADREVWTAVRNKPIISDRFEVTYKVICLEISIVWSYFGPFKLRY
jgi:hypothetical protein